LSAPDVNTGVQRFSFGVTELSDGIGFIVVAVGVFAIGEIIANLGDPEERKIFTEKVKNLMPTREDLKASVGPINARHAARLILRRAARHRPGHRIVRVLHGGKRSLRKTRRASAEAPLRASPGPESANNATRNASSFRC